MGIIKIKICLEPEKTPNNQGIQKKKRKAEVSLFQTSSYITKLQT